MLMLTLFPAEASSFLLREALMHDCGEAGTGDLPWTARARHPRLAHAVDEAGEDERFDLGFPAAPMTRREAEILDLCDRLEAALFVAARAPHVLDRDGWPEAREAIRKTAHAMCVLPAVDALMREAGA